LNYVLKVFYAAEKIAALPIPVPLPLPLPDLYFGHGHGHGQGHEMRSCFEFSGNTGYSEAVEQNRPEGVDFLLAARPQ
jgi:hypothetical protein